MAFDRDLVVLVPDGAIRGVITTLLANRRDSLQLRELAFDVVTDALRDSSPESQAVDLLRGFLRSHERALLLRDLAGSGWERRGAAALERELVRSLTANGWSEERVRAIVIEPELEIWLRLDSPHLQSLVAERARRNANPTARQIAQQVHSAIGQSGGELHGKPRRPKESFETILEHFSIPRSNALYWELARQESLQGCAVPSFNRLVGSLKQWFGIPGDT